MVPNRNVWYKPLEKYLWRALPCFYEHQFIYSSYLYHVVEQRKNCREKYKLFPAVNIVLVPVFYKLSESTVPLSLSVDVLFLFVPWSPLAALLSSLLIKLGDFTHRFGFRNPGPRQQATVRGESKKWFFWQIGPLNGGGSTQIS